MLYQEIVPLHRRQFIDACAKPIPLLGESQEECFSRHKLRNTFHVGDTVRFKKPKKNPVRGVVFFIEEDINKVRWSNQGSVPNYIHVSVTERGQKIGDFRTFIVDTHEGRLLLVHPYKEKVQ